MQAAGIVPALQEAPLRDGDGMRVGAIEELLAEPQTNRPAWLVVCLDDGRRTVVPARGARPTLEGTRTPHPAALVAACPATLTGSILAGEHLVGACSHYGVPLPARPLLAR
jgi:hypothetical protein